MTPQSNGVQRLPCPVSRMPPDDLNKNEQKSEKEEVAGRHKNEVPRDQQADHKKDHRGGH